MGKHRARRVREVIRHRQRMSTADVWAAVVALLLLAGAFGLMAYLTLTIPANGGTTP